jgi:branched-chain amino acid transport system substrate-binding protein
VGEGAGQEGRRRPTTEEVIAAFEGISYPTPSTTVQMALGNGHQGISDTAVGTYKFDKAEASRKSWISCAIPPQCVNPPADVDSVPWLKAA